MSWMNFEEWIPVYHDDADNPDMLYDKNYDKNEFHTVSYYWDLIDKNINFPFHLNTSDYFKTVLEKAVKKIHDYFVSLNVRAVQLPVQSLDDDHALHLQINRDGKYDFFILHLSNTSGLPVKWKSGKRDKASRSRKLKCWYLVIKNWKTIKDQIKTDEELLEMVKEIESFNHDPDSVF